MTRATCFICGKPANGLVDISRSVGERRDVSSERFYLCSDHLECGLTIAPGQARMADEELRTIYYGVWSGEPAKEWWYLGREIFHTLSLGLARAQAVMVSGWLAPATWEARAIGEDGLPAGGPLPEAAEQKSHECAMCGQPAKEWVDVRIKGWMCEQHSHVSVGCLSDEADPDDAFVGVG